MALIDWTDNMSVQITSIDAQHKKLVGMINDFYEGLKNKGSDQLMGELIGKMNDYISYHFSYEEELFKKHGYPDYTLHLREHQAFIAKIADVEKRFREGKMILSIEITTFLKDWLIKHIQGTDKKYTSFLLSKGVK
ncbi:MAG: bacteriohemerythrin [Bacteroidota bacterium]